MDFVGKRLKQLLICPTRAIPELLETGSLGQAANVVMASAVLGALSVWAYMTQDGAGAEMPVSVYAAQFVKPFLICLVWSSVCYALGCLAGGKGKLRPLLMMFGYLMVLDVLAYLYTLLRVGIGVLLPSLLEVLRLSDQLLALGFFFWELLLTVLTVRIALHLSTARAALVVLVPIVLLALLSGVVLIALHGIAG